MDKIVSIQLDSSLGKPLYIQIYEGLVDLIENKTLLPGEKLPSIRQMASFLNVNTVTVVNAYKRLELQGYANSRIGSGTYVKMPPQKINPDIFTDSKGNTFQETEREYSASESNLIKYNFSDASLPPKYYPIHDFKQAVNEILNRDGGYAFEYQQSSGYTPLRQSIQDYIHLQHQLPASFEEIQIVSGAQQGIDILSKAFLNPGDVVYVESPTYPGAVNAFKSRNARIVEIKMEKDGIDLDEFEKNLKQNPTKLFYCMPTFQNPTGISYSAEKKKELIALSKKYGFYIIEDDHISELYYGQKPSLLKSLDDEGRVFYIKSFSKLFMPGLRMAFLWVPKCLFDKIALAKYSSDISSSGFSQRIMDFFLRKGLWLKHIDSLRKTYAEKWQIASSSLERYFSKSVKYCIPQGGYFFWISLPKGLYSIDLYHEALKEGISIMPGNLFFIDQKPTESLRLSIAKIPTGDIEQGIKLLWQCIDRLIQGSHRAFADQSYRPLL